MNKPLLVLNASAGSGKTYNLVRNYLKLILSEGENHAEVGQILAMTFTNKASIEMKTRIMSDLDKLAHSPLDSYKQLNEIAQLIGLTPEQTQLRAKHALRKILHQYEDFNVMTIDKFNLKLIRSFARDLDLPENFDISLDDDLVLEKAVDELLNSIDSKNQQRIYSLALNFAKENLEEENDWNIKKVLLEKAKVLTNEKYFNIVKSLTEKDFSQEQYALWKLQYKAEKEELHQKQEELRRLFANTECEPKDFSGKNTTYKAIVANLEMKVDPYTFLKDGKATSGHFNSIQKTIDQQIETVFSPVYLSFLDYIFSKANDWFILYFKVSQFYILAILKELALSMEDIRNKESVIRVGEFNKLVADLVQNEEAPFIYERLGTRFSHYFLDEFQDTSRLQWLNMLPLIHNSLSENKFNFIVGDPKQSIYRFKNGVAEQFVALPEIYNPENDPSIAQKSSYFASMGQTDRLEDNWRSAEQIVLFNNQFFEAFKEQLPSSGKDYYVGVAQNPKGKKGGYVELVLDYDEEGLAPDTRDKLLLKWVHEAIQDGYKPADICVLGLRRKECNHYANLLKKHQYQVVSSDSLLVDSDKYVQLAIHFCKWKINRFDKQRAMQFASSYFITKKPEQAFERYNSCFESHPQTGKNYFSESRFFEQCSLKESLLQASFQNIYTLLVDFFKQLTIDPIENSYVQQLLDLAYQFDLKNGPDLLEFIHYYEQKIEHTNVILTENEEAIQIMTAHKSKGLEFPIVLIPNMNFTKQVNQRSMLLEIDEHIVESNLSDKQQKIPEIKEAATKEKDAEMMDAINLLYVAFTRAQDRLHAFLAKPSKGKAFFDTVGNILLEYFPQTTQEEQIRLEYGVKPKRDEQHKAHSNFYKPDSLADFLWFPDISIQSKKEQEEDALTTAQRLGKQFHFVMEKSQSKEQALKQLQIGIVKGFIEAKFEDILRKLVDEAFDNEHLARILTSGTHLNERTLISDLQNTFRPDKLIVSENQTIVLDFKTGEKLPKHEKQVQTYMHLLEEVGLPHIKGYLYYTGGLGLVEVEKKKLD